MNSFRSLSIWRLATSSGYPANITRLFVRVWDVLLRRYVLIRRSSLKDLSAVAVEAGHTRYSFIRVTTCAGRQENTIHYKSSILVHNKLLLLLLLGYYTLVWVVKNCTDFMRQCRQARFYNINYHKHYYIKQQFYTINSERFASSSPEVWPIWHCILQVRCNRCMIHSEIKGTSTSVICITVSDYQ